MKRQMKRNGKNLSDALDQQLRMYVLVAGAAGVGMLALTPSADAKIIYRPAHLKVGDQKVALDLNHDGKADFDLLQSFITTTSVGEYSQEILTVIPIGRNQIMGGVTNTQLNSHYAAALAAGVQIGPKDKFSEVRNGMAWFGYGHGTGGSGTCGGHWFNVKNRFLGLAFRVEGKLHYGWARLNVACTTGQRKATGTITGYAYESVPNKPIAAGKTEGADDSTSKAATLGHLARGVSAISAWRSAGPASGVL
jgi:hypothetical protein